MTGRFLLRLCSLFRRRAVDRELDDELRFHLERQIAENVARGMPAEEARYAALREFGGVDQVREECRDMRKVNWLQDFVLDLHYGWRMLRHSPGFTGVAILTLALGIGANTAIFSLIDAVMLRSLPAEKPSELVLLQWSARQSPKFRGYMSWGDCRFSAGWGVANPSGCSFPAPMFRAIERTNQFAGVAAFANSGPLALTGNGPATMISGQLVSGDFFRTLSIRAAAGRVLEASDDSPTATPVAILNYGYWQSAFGGSREALGRTIELNGAAFTIAGVAQQGFTGITPGTDFDVWLPLSAGPRITDPMMWSHREDNVTFWWLTLVGRLKRDATLSATQAAISGAFRNEMLHGQVPLFDAGGMFAPLGPLPGAGPGPKPMILGGPPAGGASPMPMPPGEGAKNQVIVPGAAPLLGGPKAAAKAPGPAAAPMKAAPGQAPPTETAGAPATLSKPDDEPAVTLVSAQTGLTGLLRHQFANPLYVLMFAVAIILLIACCNVAGLMLARATSRQKEMALRLALGAGRPRIVRQLLTESAMLAGIGGVLGIALASWGARAIVSFVSANQPRPFPFAGGVDLRALGFTVAVSLLTGILFGLAPAFRGVRVDLTPALKEGSGVATGFAHAGARRFAVGNLLVVTQVALAVVVLAGAGLLVRTLRNLRSIDVGFETRNLVIFGIDPTLAGYKDAQIDSFYRDLQERLSETPGVRSASYSMVPLLSGALMFNGFHWPGTPQDRVSQADMLPVGPDFFHTMQIPFLAGRSFNASDYEIAASKVQPETVPTPVIVDQAFVEKYLGKENPLGKRFGESAAGEEGPASPGYEIIGVVRDTKYSVLRREINPTMYTPQSGSGAAFEVRTAGDPQGMVPAIRRVVAELNPNLPLRDVTTESQQIDRLLFQERLIARLAGFFGSLSLALACIGLYGLLAYEVARRTREIGIRMTLGAQAGDVLRLVVRQGLVLALVGAAIGIGAAFGVTRFLASLLYEVRAADPLTFASVAALLVIVAALACYLPARRATRVDPMVALRHE